MSERNCDLAFALLELAEARHELYMIEEAVRRGKLSGMEVSISTKDRFERLRERIECAQRSCGYAEVQP